MKKQNAEAALEALKKALKRGDEVGAYLCCGLLRSCEGFVVTVGIIDAFAVFVISAKFSVSVVLLCCLDGCLSLFFLHLCLMSLGYCCHCACTYCQRCQSQSDIILFCHNDYHLSLMTLKCFSVYK